MLYDELIAEARVRELARARGALSRSAAVRGENLLGTERAAVLAPDRRHLARLSGGRGLHWDLRRSGAA